MRVIYIDMIIHSFREYVVSYFDLLCILLLIAVVVFNQRAFCKHCQSQRR